MFFRLTDCLYGLFFGGESRQVRNSSLAQPFMGENKLQSDEADNIKLQEKSVYVADRLCVKVCTGLNTRPVMDKAYERREKINEHLPKTQQLNRWIKAVYQENSNDEERTVEACYAKLCLADKKGVLESLAKKYTTNSPLNLHFEPIIKGLDSVCQSMLAKSEEKTPSESKEKTLSVASVAARS